VLSQKFDQIIKLISNKRQKSWATNIELSNALYDLEQELYQVIKGGEE